MRNKKFDSSVLILFTFIAFGGCTSMSSKSDSAVEGAQPAVTVEDHSSTGDGAIILEYRPVNGREEKYKHYIHSMTKTFENDQLRRSLDETVDFVLHQKVSNYEPPSTEFTLMMKTEDKEGTVDLMEYGYPNKGEELEFLITKRGHILKAGKFPKDSHFFIPHIALPTHSVKIGETWTNAYQWKSLANEIPLEVEVQSKLVRTVPCGTELCVEIKTNGVIRLHNLETPNLSLDSRVEGRILFNASKGTMLWFQTRNSEKFIANDIEIQVESCAESLLVFPEVDRWKFKQDPKCDPAKSLQKIPGV